MSGAAEVTGADERLWIPQVTSIAAASPGWSAFTCTTSSPRLEVEARPASGPAP
jgi:hypothetical protein